jgi:hypothetical protein
MMAAAAAPADRDALWINRISAIRAPGDLRCGYLLREAKTDTAMKELDIPEAKRPRARGDALAALAAPVRSSPTYLC